MSATTVRTLTLGGLTLAALLAAGSASAEEFGDEALALCEKVKSCALEQLGAQDLPPNMRESMKPMLDNMCASMQNRFQEVPKEHELYQPALSCMQSMAALTCASLMEGEAETPECKSYQEKAKKYGE